MQPDNMMRLQLKHIGLLYILDYFLDWGIRKTKSLSYNYIMLPTIH